MAVQLAGPLAGAAGCPASPSASAGELLLRLGTALRDTGDAAGRSVLVEAARLAEAAGRPRCARRDPRAASTSTSLWAGYDWNLHDARVVAAIERALAQPSRQPSATGTMLTMADWRAS